MLARSHMALVRLTRNAHVLSCLTDVVKFIRPIIPRIVEPCLEGRYGLCMAFVSNMAPGR